MTRKEWHQKAIEILDLAEFYQARAQDNLQVMNQTDIPEYAKICENHYNRANRALGRILLRYNRHILSLKELEF